MKRVYFVRHGETEGNINGISQDEFTPLTANGRVQAQVLAKRVAQLGVGKIYTSHMVRAVDTGKYIGEALGLVTTPSPLFREWMTPKSVRGKQYNSDEYKRWRESLFEHYHESDWRYEDAENFSDLEQRLHEVTKLLEEDDSESILVVSHGKFMRLFLAFILNGKHITPALHMQIDKTTSINNTGITLFDVNEKEWCLITWNDRAHFADN